MERTVMSAIDKEKIFEKLRTYHTDKFPAKINNAEVDDLKNKFNVAEDRIIGMVLSLVNGKAEYVDSAKELGIFQSTLKSIRTSDTDEANKVLFESKIDKLIEIMNMAKNSDFRLRRGIGKIIRV
jgi:hypothetical protein